MWKAQQVALLYWRTTLQSSHAIRAEYPRLPQGQGLCASIPCAHNPKPLAECWACAPAAGPQGFRAPPARA